MGRDTAFGKLPHYREVLIATAVRAVRDSLPDAPGFPSVAERRAWIAAAVDAAGWRAVAVAAGAIPDHPVSR